MVYRLIVLVGRVALRLLGLRRRLDGLENVPAAGGAVLAITHFSYLDFVLAGWVSHERNGRLVRFLATAHSFRHPVAGPLMRAMRHVPVERDGGGDAYRLAVERLQDGELVGVFPESRVTRSFTLLPFRSGAARMAAQAGVPLVPVVIWGSHRVLTRTHRFSLREAVRAPVTIVVGEPLHPLPDSDPEQVTAALRAQMAAILERAQRDYPVTGPAGAWWQPAHLGGGAPTEEQALVLDADDPVVRRDAARRPARLQSPDDERKAI
jgi:1-acyl-sn-glycerol-3-phosphate acyltransferase